MFALLDGPGPTQFGDLGFRAGIQGLDSGQRVEEYGFRLRDLVFRDLGFRDLGFRV